MNITRRTALLGTAALPAVFLAGCVAGSSATTDAQILADAAGAVNGLTTVAGQINIVAPGSVPAAVTTALAAALQLVTSLSANTPAQAGATTLQTVDTYISDALSTIGAMLPTVAAAFPVLGAAVPIVDAVIALLPAIEAWVNPILGSLTASAAAPVKPLATVMTRAEARAVLGVPVVK